MNCSSTNDLLEDFREGVLGKPEAEAIADHLGECAACRRRLAQLDRIDLTFGAVVERATPPSGFSGQVMRRLEGETINRPSWAVSSLWIRSTAALAAGLLLIVGLWTGQSLRSSAPAGKPPAPLALAQGERPFYEPAPDSAEKIGAPFVITASVPAPYRGKTSVRVVKTLGNTPRLIVDPFPD